MNAAARSAAVDGLHALARTLRSSAEQLGVTAGRIASVVTAEGLQGRWQGPAARSAEVLLRRRAAGVQSVASALTVAEQGLVRAAAVPAPTAYSGAGLLPLLPLVPLLAIAVTVRGRSGPDGLDEAQAWAQCAGTLREAADRCRAVLRAADPGGGRAEAFRRLGPAGAQRWLAQVPAAATSPVVVARWWAAHTAAEQRSLGAAPATAAAVGSLDGVPVAARDRANRAVLARRLATWSGRPVGGSADEGGGTPTPQTLAAHEVDLRLLEQLDRVRLDPLTGQHVPVRLVVYEPTAWEGRGRAAVALGDPDTAGHVAYLVPGMGERVEPGLSGLADSAWDLFATVRRRPGGPEVATVAWYGYETPELPEVAFVHRAEVGAAALARELAGLRAARGEDQPHLTVVGHSYGSVVAALATRAAPGVVDDLAVVGSPGLTVEHAGVLPLATGHVWVGAASADPVSHLSRFGTDPAASSFGARRFPAEAVGAGLFVGQHSHYFDAGSPSLRALAAVCAGQGAAVPTVAGRTDHGYAGAGATLMMPPLLMGLLDAAPEPTFGDPAARPP